MPVVTISGSCFYSRVESSRVETLGPCLGKSFWIGIRLPKPTCPKSFQRGSSAKAQQDTSQKAGQRPDILLYSRRGPPPPSKAGAMTMVMISGSCVYLRVELSREPLVYAWPGKAALQTALSHRTTLAKQGGSGVCVWAPISRY